MADMARYLNYITSQHSDKPKYRAWLTANLEKLDDVAAFLNNVDGAFDIDTAVGAQLDILGEIIGVAREVPFQPAGGLSPILDDAHYRLALKAGIARNQWDGTIKQMTEIWATLFPTVYLILKDNQNMTMDALIIGLSDSMEMDLVTHGYIIPKPQGVLINYAYPVNPVFAYGLENDVFKGYEEGYWLEFY